MARKDTVLPRLLVAAPYSGGGKTTVTCAILQAARDRGLTPCAFKCGPDYIDPMFHRQVLGLPSRNLDLFFSGEDEVRALLERGGRGHGLAVLEGVMGLYDGVAGGDQASSWHLAGVTRTPVLLVLEPKGAALTLAAMVKGLQHFRQPSRLGGILLNCCTQSLHRRFAPVLERETGLPVLGYLPSMPQCSIPSRHLGLVTAAEIGGLQQKISLLAEQLEQTADVNGIFALAAQAPALSRENESPCVSAPKGPVVAVARDKAFCFYYQDNLDLLEAAGAQPVFFSPLSDTSLPAGTAGLYLGGGYPELYAGRLSGNTSMREAIRAAVDSGMPTLAECGGFLYLQQELEDQEGRPWPMAEVLEGRGYRTEKLQRFGYTSLTAQVDSAFLKVGERVKAHEFHRWDCTRLGEGCLSQKPGSDLHNSCVVAKGALFAGFPHLYFRSAPEFAPRFAAACAHWKEGQSCL